jgi:hypothetical protein
MGYLNSAVSSPHALLEVARKRIPGVEPLNIFGVNRAVDTAFETLWDGPNGFTLPGSALQMTAASSSASDTMPLLIQGLDEDYQEISDIITLNGTTGVTTTQNFFRINSAVILSGSNAGNISISNGGAVYAYIGVEIGLTQACAYTVPADHELFLFRIDLTSGTVNPNKYISYRNVTRTATGRVLRVAEATWQTGQQSFDRQVPFRIAEKTDFSFEAKSSSGSNEVSIFVEGLLMEVRS